ncbi:MAG: hypothetical protein PHI16_01935 [Methanocellales archaeon]|nr:hypothetical protein [Methanocellales archaeon]
MPKITNPAKESEVEYSTPSEKVVKKTLKEFDAPARDYVELPENMAGETKLVHKFQSVAAQFLDKYQGQASRKEMEEYLKNADAKYRVGRTQGVQFRESSTQVTNTLSHVASTQFYKSCKIISAALCDIIFGKGLELPVRYEPIQDSQDYSENEGERIAEGYNLYLNWAWFRNKYNDILKQSVKRLVKNANEIFSVQWDYSANTRIERVPGYYDKSGKAIEYDPTEPPEIARDKDGNEIELFDEDGRPRQYVFVEKTRVINNGPVIERHDLKNTFLDLDIDSIQDQQCIIFYSQKPYSYLLAKAKSGEFMNLDKVTSAQLFREDDTSTDTINNERDTNADHSRDRETNGLYDTYHVWMLAPINGEKKEWDSEQIPEIHEAFFVGKLRELDSEGKVKSTKKQKENDAAAVCMQLRSNPYHHKRYPYHDAHSHDDERGWWHMGLYSLLECNIEEQTATKNNTHDNFKLGVKAPFIGERGNVLSRDTTFHNGNQVLWVKAGTGQNALTKLNIPDYTQLSIPLLNELKTDADETAGTMDAVKGEYAGSRTTGTEILTANKQAMKPLIEDARFISNQYLVPIAEDVADLAKQFGDPDKLLTVTDANNSILGQVNPAELYGDCDIKITSIDRFEADLEMRQVLINFITSGGFLQSKEYMGQTGGVTFWRTVADAIGLPDVDKIYPEGKRMVEAENQAYADLMAIQNDPTGAMTNPELLPKEGEMHDIHIPILEGWGKKLKILMGDPDLSPEQKNFMRQQYAAVNLYVQIHNELKSKEAMGEAMMQTQGGVQNQASEVPAQPGEAAGDTLSGIQGQLAG